MDDLYKWLHYNHMVVSYYSLCHVTCTLKLDEVTWLKSTHCFVYLMVAYTPHQSITPQMQNKVAALQSILVLQSIFSFYFVAIDFCLGGFAHSLDRLSFFPAFTHHETPMSKLAFSFMQLKLRFRSPPPPPSSSSTTAAAAAAAAAATTTTFRCNDIHSHFYKENTNSQQQRRQKR